jgi:hypothetical protein
MTGRDELRWRKASRSSNTGANCVEVAGNPAWRKASRSGNTGGNCVEVAGAVAGWAVRDSKNPAGPVLVLGGSAFDDLRSALKAVR